MWIDINDPVFKLALQMVDTSFKKHTVDNPREYMRTV